MAEFSVEHVGLALLSLALLISLIVNVIFCIKRRAFPCTDECCDLHIYERQSSSQDEGHYFHNPNHLEPQENLHNHREQQENPIYGNISTDREASVDDCYETMTRQHPRDSTKPDLNYASLDLKVANKHKKKHRHQQGHAQGRNKVQDQLPVRLTPPTNTFLEVEADMDAQLPSRDTSITVSYNSIYLNSHQIAQETEDMERGRGMNMCWDGMRSQEDGGSRDWKGEHESEERRDRQDYSNGSVCTQLSQAEAIESGTNDFTSSFSHDSVQQD